MKKMMFMAALAAALMMTAMPAEAQTRKDKKAAKKENWEMQQQQQREEAELRHQLRMDSIRNAQKAAADKAAREEADRRQAEAEAKAKQKRAEEAAALQEVEFNEPCTGFESDADMIRGRGIGEDLDHQFSVDLARTSALENMASQISTKVQALLSRNRKQAKKGLSRESLQKAEDMVQTEVDQTTGYRVACTKTMTFTENGQRVFKTYMVVEAGASQLLKPLYDGLQQEEDLQLDMNFNEFKQQFDQHFNNAQ